MRGSSSLFVLPGAAPGYTLLLAVLCVVVSLPVPGIASTTTVSDAEGSVGVLGFHDHVRIGIEASSSLHLCLEYEPAYDKSRRGLSPVPRGTTALDAYLLSMVWESEDMTEPFESTVHALAVRFQCQSAVEKLMGVG